MASTSKILIIISIYDIIAVWKIKHMVTLAKYQSENNLFAGAMVPYGTSKKKENTSSNVKMESNI